MRKHIETAICFVLAWIFLAIAIIGIFLPLLPTTPFLILSAACFAKGSPRFHKKLLENKYFGEDLKKWENTKTVSKKTKIKATSLVILSFSISILILNSKIHLQIMLLSLALILLFFIWRLKEQ